MGDHDELVAAYLDERERRFAAALDGLGIPHNGPQGVELHDGEALYCVPERALDLAGVDAFLDAFARQSVDYDVALIAERLEDGGCVQQWPEDEGYGPGNAFECDTSDWPAEARYRLHLWLDESPWVAGQDVADLLAEDPSWRP